MSADTETRRRFDELQQGYFRAWFRYHPEAAVDAGVAGYEQLLTPCGEEERGALVCLNDELRVGLEEIDIAALDVDRGLDYQLLHGAARLENQFIVEIESRRPDPHRFLPVNAIYQLTVRAVENFDEAMLARLAAVPAHLSAAQLRLAARAREIPLLWVQSAAAEARGGADFVRGLAANPRVATSTRRDALVAQAQNAAAALARFAEFLGNGIAAEANGAFACGEEYFHHLLRERHFLDVDAQALHAFGTALLERTRRELAQTCRELFGHDDVPRALKEIQSRHPSRAELLTSYTATMHAARDFIIERDLVSLPPRERVEVVETPVFLRHQIPFAAYYEPTPNDPEQVGHYYVTPPADDAQLREHDEVSLMHTCVHEAYPGHHLHFSTLNGNPVTRSLPRLLNASATCYEGWALYSEQLMQEQGFLARPESRIVLLRDRLWRALRVCLDIELHTRGLGIEAAADRMVAILGFPRSQALADLTWYTQMPTVPLGYATGWALINALRARIVAPGSSLRDFHDRLLSAGAIALPLAIQRAFGEDSWRSIRADVFGET